MYPAAAAACLVITFAGEVVVGVARATDSEGRHHRHHRHGHGEEVVGDAGSAG